MKTCIIAPVLIAAAWPAAAQTIAVAPIAEARLRFEHVSQDDLPLEGDALTIRARAGATAAAGPFAATVVAQGTLAAIDDYNDGLHGPAARPLVADPENVALYVAQLQYRTPAMTVTGGRQRIALDDERYVGNIAFRDNAQTFDAVRVEAGPVPGVKLDISYAWSVRTIWGVEGQGARPQAIGGTNLFANLSWKSPVGTLTGFAYLIDQNAMAVQNFRLSSQSYGVRLAGAQKIGDRASIAYQASYGVQSDWQRNPNDYRAAHWLVDAALVLGPAKLIAGREVLGADGGTPFTSFQFPLGTNFKFQGWADKFLSTPPNGVRDLYGGGGIGWPKIGPFSEVAIRAVYHRFDSDRLAIRYGDEVDLLASAKLGKYQMSVRYARYDANAFAADTQKAWLQLDWAF